MLLHIKKKRTFLLYKNNFNTLVNKLFEVELFRIKNIQEIKEYTDYDLFYFIAYKNKLLKSNYKSIEKRIKENLFMHKNLVSYLNEIENIFFSELSSTTKENLQIYIYAIPRIKLNRKKFNTLYDIYYETIEVSFFKKTLQILQKNSNLLSYLFAIYFFIYSSYLYFGLNSIGIPIQLITDAHTVLSLISFLLVVFISLISLIPLLLILAIHYQNDFLLYGTFIALALISIVFIANRFNLSHKLKPIVKHSKTILLDTWLVITTLILSALLGMPFLYVIDSSRFHNTVPLIGEPIFLYDMYNTLTGHLSIGYIDNNCRI